MRSLSSVLASRCVTLGVAALLTLAPLIAHAQIKPPPPPPPPLPPLSLPQGIALDPPVPCAERPVTILVIVPHCDSCSAVAADRGARRVDILVRGACAPYAPCALDTIPLPLGWLAAGFHSVGVTLRYFHFDGNTPLDTTETHLDVQMVVAATCTDTTAQLPDTWVNVGRLNLPVPPSPIASSVACEGRPIPVLVGGTLPGSCWSVRRVELVASPLTVIAPPTLRIWLNDISPCVRMVCPLTPVPWMIDTLLPALPRGEYRLRVQLAYTSCFEQAVPDSTHDGLFPFAVSAGCPPGEILPYVDRIQVGTPACASCPPVVCPGQPFTVTLSGTLPDDCVAFRGVQVIPSMDMSPIGAPPSVRARFAINDCMGRPCVQRPATWSATVELPPWLWPAERFPLSFTSVLESMCDSTRWIAAQGIGRRVVLADSCPSPPPTACLRVGWGPPPTGRACNATFVNDTASVELRVASPVALAGLQGVLRTQPGLEIRGLHPTGPAAGMTLEWTRTLTGATFILFAPRGAPIPALAPAPDDTAFQFAPVLRVEVKRVPYVSIALYPPVTVFALRADSLLGADSLGLGVPGCLLRCLDGAVDRCGPAARICIPARCDANHDGRSDVRDLVLMVRCLVPGGSCPDSTARYDCNDDGAYSLDDVMCCALGMLHGYEHGGGGRPEPAVALGFGQPVRTGELLELPLTLSGAERVGAARVVLRFPAARYEVDDFELVGNPPGWLALHEVMEGDIVVGLIALDPSQAGATLPLSLRLRLRPGAEHGGEVVARDADVSAGDGAALATAIEGAGAVLDPASAVALSAVRPNPSPGTARFALSLPRASEVDLAVHDLAGRRVATLQRGALAAGVHPFAWDGRTDRGETARDGVYFIRLRCGGTEVARKTVLMRGH